MDSLAGAGSATAQLGRAGAIGGPARDFAFEVRTLFDTMIAARILGYARWGLADLLRESFEVTLDKRFQRLDWAQRPLPRPALEYAAADASRGYAGLSLGEALLMVIIGGTGTLGGSVLGADHRLEPIGPT